MKAPKKKTASSSTKPKPTPSSAAPAPAASAAAASNKPKSQPSAPPEKTTPPAPPAPPAPKAAPAAEKPRAVASEPAQTPAPPGKVKRAKPALPPELLEGDQPAPQAPAGGPGRRYDLGLPGAGTPQSAPGEPSELPESYGTGRLLLTARDPRWVYAHWDYTRAQIRDFNRASKHGHLFLRVHRGSAPGTVHSEVAVHPDSRNWFVHVGQGATTYVAELGYYARRGGAWTSLSVSRATLTPPADPAPEGEVQFASLPDAIPPEQLLEVVRQAVRDQVPLQEVLGHLRATGHSKLPTLQAARAPKWTPEQTQALAQVVTMDQVRRVWMGSLEITELIRRRMVTELASAAAAEFSRPTSPTSAPGGAVALGALGSLASPFGGEMAGRARGFWFNVNAELIIYGATEPDATVTLAGRTIRLRPDGTFSYRFALPDGDYQLPATATSADRVETRVAALAFRRTTDYTGDVGRHPQDPALKAPVPDSIA